MESYKLERDAKGRESVSIPYRGNALLDHAMFNKGTAFTLEERKRFKLLGLLPDFVNSIEQQARRIKGNIDRKQDPLERYIGLASLQERNEVLFYYLLLQNIEEYLPIVYTPTVGLACQQYSRIFRRARGFWITPEHRGNILEVLGNAPFEDVRLIVVTDNERILGLGDQGAGGMGIPLGKLALYTVAAGIHPTQTLPISLDVGTDNPELLDDELYLGWRHRRLRGDAYYDLVEEFVEAVKERFPHALLQWEDFKKGNAFTLLDRYAERILSFNDDIQGTAAIALAGVMAGNRITNASMRQQRVVILGAGAAGIGIARQLREAMRRDGLGGNDLRRAIAIIDSTGLLMAGREKDEPYKSEFAWPVALAEELGLPPGTSDLTMVVEKLKCTVLIGTSGQPGIFDERVVRAMAKNSERPMIFPFSNPTSKSEAVPADIFAWTDGKALVATGSPFAPVDFKGRQLRTSQGNNVYIFPGVGLGALAGHATRVTDAMFTAAAEALAAQVEPADLQAGALYPRIAKLRRLTQEIAFAVAREARESGLASRASDQELRDRVAAMMWTPRYPDSLVPV